MFAMLQPYRRSRRRRDAAAVRCGGPALTRLSGMPEEKYVAVAHRPAAQPQHGEAAFFDVDNTLMRAPASSTWPAKCTSAAPSRSRRRPVSRGSSSSSCSRGENIDDVHAVRDSALTLAAGITVEDIKALGEEVYDEMIASRIWPGAKALAEQHLRVGRKVWLVTATPIEVATVISTPAGPDRRPRDGGRDHGRHVHRPAGGRHPARRGQGRGGPGHRRRRGPGPEALLGLQRLLQRHPAADAWWATRWPSTRTPGCASHAREHNWPVYDFRSGRRAATLGLKAATAGGAVYGLWQGFARIRGPGFTRPGRRS